MIAHVEARWSALPIEATAQRPSQLDPPVEGASVEDAPVEDASPIAPGVTPAHARSDRERGALPRCCEGWIGEQVHTWART